MTVLVNADTNLFTLLAVQNYVAIDTTHLVTDLAHLNRLATNAEGLRMDGESGGEQGGEWSIQ